MFLILTLSIQDLRPQTGFITTLTEKNYSGTEFAAELQTKMRADHGTTNFSVVFNAFKSKYNYINIC